MARLTIEDKWWTDPRRERLGSFLGGMHLADAAAIRAWRLAQEYWGRGYGLVPKEMFDTLDSATKLLESGLAVLKGDKVYIRGSSQYLSWLHESRLQASAGGKKSAESRKKKTGTAQPPGGNQEKRSKRNRSDVEPPIEPESNRIEPSYSSSSSFSSSSSSSGSDSDSGLVTSSGVDDRPPHGLDEKSLQMTQKEANRKTWSAFSDAYFDRYKIHPTRNAKVNSSIANFVKRVGETDAPLIVRFFVFHNDSLYVKSMHSISLALRDAEALRTQWLKGRAITQSDIRRFEQNQQHHDLISAIERGEV